MDLQSKLPSLWRNFFKLGLPQIRAFHMSWIAFFLCFFAWFGIAPLMLVVRDELNLSKSQVGWTMIASVAATIVARLVMGWLCDKIGPRITYTWLLILGSLPVMCIGFAYDFQSFLIFRLLIGCIGGSFVITQYHTSVMFAPNVVGTANATSAGWGTFGGGVTQVAMPALFTLFVSTMGFSTAFGWRAAMVVAGIICFLTGIAYYFFTQDTPEGNFKELRKKKEAEALSLSHASSRPATKNPSPYTDYRVWVLAFIYAACFGIELTVVNVAALYFADYFGLGFVAAGGVAGLFGLMNLFARTLGGMSGDWFGGKWGLRGRVTWLFIALFCEGVALMFFSQMTALAVAIPALIAFSLFVQMSEGATFSVVPFINKKALGPVAGIVGAGGNAGAVAAGFLFKSSVEWPTAFLILGCLVAAMSFLAFTIRFNPIAETEAKKELAAAERQKQLSAPHADERASELEPVLNA